MTADTTNIDSLNLLDKSIDDIESLPGFEVPPNGVYALKMNTKLKPVNDKPCIEADFEVLETIEMNDAALIAPKPGTKFSMLFQVGNDIALSKFKEMVMPIAEFANEKNVGKLVTEVIKDLAIIAVVKQRKNKDNEDRPYAEVSKIKVQ